MAHRPERTLSRGPLTLRTACSADAAALTEILRAASLANPGDRDWLLAHPEVMVVDAALLADGRIVVAERDGLPLGFVSVLLPQAQDVHEAELDGVFVHPRHWRQGVGRALVDAGAARSRVEGATRLRVVVNPHALAFYDGLGFELCQQPQAVVAAGVAWVMVRRLDANGPATQALA